MTITITAFAQSPDRGRGLARDMPVRWALEELGLPHRVRRLSFAALREPGHRALQPFGQIPTFEDGEVVLFESGAIVLHLAQRHPGLLPDDPAARARATSWLFAAQATLEAVVLQREVARLSEADQPWFAAREPLVQDRIHQRLGALAAHLGKAKWLDGAFSAGDLMVISVLRRPSARDLLGDHPGLVDYVARGEARPAFVRAFAAQQVPSD